MDKKNLYIFKDGDYHDVNAGFITVTINNTSGTLSDEDYAALNGDSARALVAPVLLYKDRNASTLIVYKSIPFVNNSKTFYYELEITKSTKAYTLRQIQLSGVNQDLLGATTLYADGELVTIRATFTNIDTTKLTANTILIFTYGNCFVLTPLSQTGEARVLGNLVYDNSGNSRISKLKFNLSNNTIEVVTDCPDNFAGAEHPTAYLLAFNVL